MTSYSKIFKATQLSVVNGVRVISAPALSKDHQLDETMDDSKEDASDVQHKRLEIEENAESKVRELMAEAEQNIQSLEAEAEERINRWWEDNQAKLETMKLEAQQQGYQEGFQNGEQEAKSQIQQEYQERLLQIQSLLEQAYEQKKAIIAEAEPFLLELSTAIASQIIKQELSEHPDKFVELIKQHILRFKEKEFITVCVHPDDFEFIQSQRTHLVAVVNGETEIKIIPDHSVTPKGCIIRTAYGSVDARIDTQLEEIKKVILEAGRESDLETLS